MAVRHKRVLAVVGVLLAAAVATEVVLRAAFGLGSPPLVYRDTRYGYAFVPRQSLKRFGHRIYYNVEGLRSEELDRRPRILCVGDSVTNGGALTDQRETFPYLLEARLLRLGKNYQVLNASAGGWAPANELAFLRAHGTHGAKLVVLQIGTHNLWQDELAELSDVRNDRNFPERNPPLAIEEALLRYLWPRLVKRLPHEMTPDAQERTDGELAHSLSAIDHMVAFARSKSTVVVLLFTQDREEIEKPPDFVQKRAATDALGRQSLMALCRKDGIPLIDMLPRFARRWNPVPFRDSVHPNPAGNRVIADAVAEATAALL